MTKHEAAKKRKAAREFEVFKRECDRWIRYWGLLSWGVKYFHTADDDCDSHCLLPIDGSRGASLCLSLEPENTPQENAFHEVAELLLGRIRILAMSRTATEEEIDGAIHEVIETLTNTVYRDVKPKG